MGADLIRESAYKLLGVSPADVAALPSITPELRRIHRTIRRSGRVETRNIPASPIYWLNTSEDPDARKLLAAYYKLSPAHRRVLPIEAFCAATHVSPIRILELITLACIRVGAQASAMIAAVTHPIVTAKTVEFALDADGIADRNTLHKATGFLPTPKSAQTNISITQNANAAALAGNMPVVPAPVPEQTIRRAIDRFNEGSGQRALPPTSAIPVPTPTAAKPIDAEFVVVGNACDEAASAMADDALGEDYEDG